MTYNDAKQGNLVIHRGWPEQGVYVVSPFVIKLEARLRFAGLPYKTEAGSSFRAPKGKIPYVSTQVLNPVDLLTIFPGTNWRRCFFPDG